MPARDDLLIERMFSIAIRHQQLLRGALHLSMGRGGAGCG